MSKVLILSQAYPSEDNIYNNSFVHSRNIEYLKLGIQVDVINFLAQESYTYERINVFTKKSKIDVSAYDAVVSHAPNIKNHYIFIKKKLNKIKSLVFVFHGHEALYVHDYYPKPYPWEGEESFTKVKLRYAYDFIKLKLLKSLMKNTKSKSIFVSNWMKSEGFKCLGIKNESEVNYKIINNPINFAFYNNSYKPEEEKLADYIAIRPLKGSKYAVDLVVEFAKNNPGQSFHIYGKGPLFDNIIKPENITVFSNFIEQKNIPELLNKYSAAIIPTRLDAQGVMMCEMVSYGMPTIVSDLPVCHEMLDGFENCTFIANDNFSTTKNESLHLKSLEDKKIIEKFAPQILAEKEIEYILS